MAAPTSDTLKPDVKEMENISEGMDGQVALARRGAELIEEEMKLSIWASVKHHWRAMMYCSAAFSVGSMFGYDVIVNGASLAMPAFLLYFGEKGPTGLYLSSTWAALWTAMSYLAQALGSIVAAPVIDRFGRKYPAMFAGAVTVAGTTAQYYSTSNGVLLLGKMINGFGVGAAFATGTAYASEIAPERLRAQVQSALVLFMVVMQTLAMGILRIFVPIIAESSFRTVFAIQWAVGGLVVISFLLVPESPTYLIKAGKIERARATMQKLYGRENSIDARLAYLTQRVEEDASHVNQDATYTNCFRGTNLKRTMTALFIQVAVGLSGGSFLAQGGYFLVSAGLPAIHTFDVTIGGFGLAIIFIIISWFTMDKIGRRVMFISGTAVNAVGMLIIGACSYAPGMAPLWVIAILMNFLISWQSVTMVSMGWVIVAELSTYSLRAKTQSLSVAVQALTTWFFTFIMPYIYNVDAGNLGAKTGFIFMGTGIILSVSAWYLVPDTAALKVEEVDWLYSQRIAPRTFQERAKDAKDFLTMESGEKGGI